MERQQRGAESCFFSAPFILSAFVVLRMFQSLEGGGRTAKSMFDVTEWLNSSILLFIFWEIFSGDHLNLRICDVLPSHRCGSDKYLKFNSNMHTLVEEEESLWFHGIRTSDAFAHANGSTPPQLADRVLLLVLCFLIQVKVPSVGSVLVPAF